MDRNFSALYAENTTDDTPQLVSIVEAVIVGVILGFIDVATITGNILVILAVFRDRALRSSKTNYFITSLAFADLLLGVTVLPFSLANTILGYWVFGPIMCDIWTAVDVLCCTASILNLCAISFDRYLAISRPLEYPSLLTKRRAVTLICLAWIVAIAISIAPFFGWQDLSNDISRSPPQCELTSGKGYVVYSALGSFYIPMIIMVILYTRIFVLAMRHTRHIRRGRKRLNNGCASNGDSTLLRIHRGKTEYSDEESVSGVSYNEQYQTVRKKHKHHRRQYHPWIGKGRKFAKKMPLPKFGREQRAARTIGIVVGIFIMCWLPFFLIYLICGTYNGCDVPPLLFGVVFWLGYCNSFLNPIIYACSSREFVRAFRKLLHMRRVRQWQNSAMYNGSVAHDRTCSMKYSPRHHNIIQVKIEHNEYVHNDDPCPAYDAADDGSGTPSSESTKPCETITYAETNHTVEQRSEECARKGCDCECENSPTLRSALHRPTDDCVDIERIIPDGSSSPDKDLSLPPLDDKSMVVVWERRSDFINQEPISNCGNYTTLDESTADIRNIYIQDFWL